MAAPSSAKNRDGQNVSSDKSKNLGELISIHLSIFYPFILHSGIVHISPLHEPDTRYIVM